MPYARLILFLNGVACIGAVLFAYEYLEKTLFMNPCPLCMLQRLAFVVIGAALIQQALHYHRLGFERKVLQFFVYAGIFFGMAMAARHLYLQSLPPDLMPACGLDYYGLMRQNGWLQGLWKAMQGSGDCGTRDTFWGIRLPVWSMVLYFILLIQAVIFLPKGRENHDV